MGEKSPQQDNRSFTSQNDLDTSSTLARRPPVLIARTSGNHGPRGWFRRAEATEALAWEAYERSEGEWKALLFQAVCAFAHAAGRDPSWWEPYHRASLLWELLGRKEKAVFYAGRALRCKSPPPEAHQAWIEIMVRAGRFGEVVERYQAESASDPDDLWPYLYLGLAYQSRAYGLLGEESLLRAVVGSLSSPAEKASSQAKDDLRRLGSLLGVALGHYRLAAERYPDRPEPLYFLGCLLSDPLAGTVQEAEAALNAALERASGRHPLRGDIVKALESLGWRRAGGGGGAEGSRYTDD